MRLTRAAYEQLIAGNREWLRQQPPSLERDHIDLILSRAVAYEYDAAREEKAKAEAQVADLQAFRDELAQEFPGPNGGWRTDKLPTLVRRIVADLQAKLGDALAETQRIAVQRNRFMDERDAEIERGNKYRDKAERAAGEWQAEVSALRADLARISEEMGLPPTIGPAPGELRRLLHDGRAAGEALAPLRAENEKARELLLEGLTVSPYRWNGYVERVEAYLAPPEGKPEPAPAEGEK
jgi:hypothetical protein